MVREMVRVIRGVRNMRDGTQLMRFNRSENCSLLITPRP